MGVRVADRLRACREPGEILAVQYPPWHRVRRRQPGKRGHWERARAGRQHQIAEPAAAQHARVGDQAYVTEDRPGRGDLRTGVRQRRTVGHVGREDPRAP
jgi:hypothetical protein